MTDLDEKHKDKPAIAHPSSSIMLLRQEKRVKSGFEVLMAKRSEDMRFAPGAYVFPGGRVDDADHDAATQHNISSEDAAYRIAALRELAEETGVEIAVERASELAYFAHWITPPESPKRFETKFYLGHTEEAHVLKSDDIETTEVSWVNPLSMLREEELGTVNMMFPTRLNLMKLAQSSTIEEAIARAKADNVTTVMPEHEMRGGEMWFTIPKSAGYPVFEVKRENIFELMGVKK